MPGQAIEKLSADNVIDPADASKYPVEVLNQYPNLDFAMERGYKYF